MALYPVGFGFILEGRLSLSWRWKCTVGNKNVSALCIKRCDPDGTDLSVPGCDYSGFHQFIWL